jgi:hypothetical protein
MPMQWKLKIEENPISNLQFSWEDLFPNLNSIRSSSNGKKNA